MQLLPGAVEGGGPARARRRGRGAAVRTGYRGTHAEHSQAGIGLSGIRLERCVRLAASPANSGSSIMGRDPGFPRGHLAAAGLGAVPHTQRGTRGNPRRRAPGFGSIFTDHMVSIRMGQGAQLARCAGGTPMDRWRWIRRGGAALRPGNLRRHQGSSPRRRFHLDLPSPGQRRRACNNGLPRDWRCRSCRWPSSSNRCASDRRRPRLGAVEAGNQPYFRPFMIATEAFLGVRAANAVSHTSSPARSARISPRAWRAGVDLAVAGLRARRRAAPARAGGRQLRPPCCCRSSWKPARTVARRFVPSIRSRAGKKMEELGGMNVFLVYGDGRIVTPALSGILDGITRSSILQLARDRSMRVEERKVSIEMEGRRASGEIAEAFAAAPPRWSRPSAKLKGKTSRSATSTFGRRGHDVDPQRTDRHPVRPLPTATAVGQVVTVAAAASAPTSNPCAAQAEHRCAKGVADLLGMSSLSQAQAHRRGGAPASCGWYRRRPGCRLVGSARHHRQHVDQQGVARSHRAGPITAHAF